MRLSIVISVLNSHEIVRRQFLHFKTLGLPGDVEILIMDDGSDPPLEYNGSLKNLHIIPVNNSTMTHRDKGMFADGRVSVARNLGAKLAKGEYLLMTDIDYIFMGDSIDAGRTLKYDKQGFRRQFGALTEDGYLTQNLSTLRQYGLLEERIVNGLRFSPHPNNFIMRKSVFWEIGGYRTNILEREYPSGGDRWFKRDWSARFAEGKVTVSPERTTIYMFPNGQWCGDVDANPLGLFHTLSRKTKSNHWYSKQKAAL